MREMGLNPALESQKLRQALIQAKDFLRRAKGSTIIAISLVDSECSVYEWEVRALGSDFPDADISFRAEFGRQIQRAYAIRAVAAEEWKIYQRKKNTTDYLWKQHYDSLVWLLFEGRLAAEKLARFAAQTDEKGLKERAEQIQKSAAKLDETLTQLAKIF